MALRARSACCSIRSSRARRTRSMPARPIDQCEAAPLDAVDVLRARANGGQNRPARRFLARRRTMADLGKKRAGRPPGQGVAGATRERILEAASDVFADKGYYGAAV